MSTRQAISDERFDIWYVDKLSNGGWGPPRRLPPPVNSEGSELLPRVGPSGDLYFGSNRAGGLGGYDIYAASLGADGEWKVRNLGAPINTPADEYEAEISTNGKMLVVVADRGNRSHLYVFDQDGSTWVERLRVPARPDVFQVGPLLSPKGERLLFAQDDTARSGEMFITNLVPSSSEAWPPDCKTRTAHP